MYLYIYILNIEWELIQSLKYNDSIEGELIKLLFISKMKKVNIFLLIYIYIY